MPRLWRWAFRHIVVVVMANPLPGFVKWQMAIDCPFGSGLQPPAGINSPVLAAHTCSQSRAGAGMMAHDLCPILISGMADGEVSLVVG